MVAIGIVVGVGVLSAAIGWYLAQEREEEVTACTMEALLCPDGSAVGRSGPQCAFLPCGNSEMPYGGVLEHTPDGFRLVMDSTDVPGSPYMLPLALRVSNSLEDFVGEEVQVYGTFTVGNTLAVETIERAETEMQGSTTLRIGASASVNGVTITPRRIVEDSRCPIDAICVQEGRVIAEVALAHGEASETATLISGETYSFEDHSITLTEVSPSRLAADAPAQGEYLLTFSVSGH